MGPETTDDGYNACLERYWNTVSGFKRPEQRIRVLVHDLKLLLLRACTKQPATDPSLGGRENSIMMLPFIIQMSLFIIDQENTGLLRYFLSVCYNDKS